MNAVHWRQDYPEFAEWFISRCFSESHSTKGIEDGVGWALETDPETLIATALGEMHSDRRTLRALAREFPGIPIVAEESDPTTFGDYRHAPRAFFVDPVDGTREFVDKNGGFAVMIGLVEDGRALASVIDAPARGDVFVGWVGQGAWRIRGGKTRSSRSVDYCRRPSHFYVSKAHCRLCGY